MSKTIYPWRRYWYPRKDRVPLTSDGFLYVLPPLLRSRSDPGLCQLQDLSVSPCLILLGEPGLGKSSALCAAYEEAKAEVSEEDFFPPFLDLKSYDGQELGVELDRILEACRQCQMSVPLFIDSLDEARLRVATVVDMIARRLTRAADLLPRLRIRIACRVGEWYQEYEDTLKALWPGKQEAALSVYQLAPLQESDVRLAAGAEGMDPDAFMQEVRRQEAGPLAATPITLGMLLSLYRKYGLFAGSRTELYRTGCLGLCSDIDRTHQEIDELDRGERLSIASRIAACTVFTNLPEVSINPMADTPPAAVSVEELAGGIEYVNDNPVPIRQKLILETLETALFTGTEIKSWAHRSYAEFLAACYVHEHLTTRQISNLLFHTAGALVPQLRGTAAWLVSMDADLLEAVVQSDPEVALRSESVAADDALKERLVVSLLHDAARISINEPRLDQLYPRLKFLGLGALLGLYLAEGDKPLAARLLAISIAEACQLRELLPELTTISLDHGELGVLRSDAADAVIRIGDDAAKAALKPLVLLPENADDPHIAELKFSGIEATWPAHLSASELFAALNTSQDEETYIHGIDLAGLIVPHLATSDYPTALAWVARQPRTHEQKYAYAMLADAIVLNSWDHLDSDAVADAFADLIVARLLHYDTIVSIEHIGQQAADQLVSVIRNDAGRRRRIVRLLVPKLSEFRQPAYYLAQSRTPMLFKEDLGWLIVQFGQTSDAQSRAIWADAILQLRDWRDLEQTEVLWSACETNPALDEALGFPFRAVLLDSPEAARSRQLLADRKKWERQVEEEQTHESRISSAVELVLHSLDECEGGKPEAWWHISRAVNLVPDSPSTFHYDSPHLEASPVWQSLDEEARVRIVLAAGSYLRAYDPGIHEWFTADRLYYPIVAGYRAFSLLLRIASVVSEVLADINTETWSKWALVLVQHTCGKLSSRSDAESASDRTLLAEAYKHAPQATSEAIRKVIESTASDGDCYRIEQIEGLIDDQLTQMLFELAENENVRLHCRVRVLGLLLKCSHSRARSTIEASLARAMQPGEFDEAVAFASLLILQTPDAGWQVVWPAIEQSAEFGRRLVEHLAVPMGRNGQGIGSKLGEDELARLLAWLLRQYPDRDRERPHGFHQVTIGEHVAWFRNAIRAQLRDRATPEALQELQQLAREFPEWGWEVDLVHATELVRSRNWYAPQPSEILRLASDHRTGLVESKEQLLELLLEALNELQARLLDHHLTVYDLWSVVTWSQVREMAGFVAAQLKTSLEQVEDVWQETNWKEVGRNKVYLPRDEEHLSDYVARYLSDQFARRGIVINREVRVRRGRTDIHINTFRLRADGSEFDPITAVVEVKGCWNRQLPTAMEAQLVNQYLSPLDVGRAIGIYLVGFFNCTTWFENDPRKRGCRDSSINELRAQLDQQALDLAEGVCVRAFVLDARLP